MGSREMARDAALARRLTSRRLLLRERGAPGTRWPCRCQPPETSIMRLQKVLWTSRQMRYPAGKQVPILGTVAAARLHRTCSLKTHASYKSAHTLLPCAGRSA